MMKAAIGILLVAGAALAIVYYGGGVESYDPGTKGTEARSMIAPGMTWDRVLDVAGEPGKYRTYYKSKRKVRGEEIEELKISPHIQFERDLFANDLNGGQMKEGFQFCYVWTHQVAYNVLFDDMGKVVGIEDERTLADLLDTRGE